MKKKKYAIILICLLVIVIVIIAINIRIPKRISINQNISAGQSENVSGIFTL